MATRSQGAAAPRVLFASSEIHPLLKTGGLADVSYSLPAALAQLGVDVRLVMPAYRAALARLTAPPRHVATLAIGTEEIVVLEASAGPAAVPLWLLAHPLFDRPGNPYLTTEGQPWPDNAQRFALWGRAAVEIAQNRAGLDWRADLVHGNDWQCGLIPALLSLESPRPATVFTIHNLAYQGLFPAETFQSLHLPAPLWGLDGLEFYGQLSFMKGGLVYADRITTVSPTYAGEIQTPAFGCGLDGLLRHRKAVVSGILNGIDLDEWNPAEDSCLAAPFHAGALDGKAVNKRAVQERLGLPVDASAPLIALISRLAQQKGIDLVLKAMPELVRLPLQMAFLGTGDAFYEQALAYWTRRHPERIATYIGFDGKLSHLLEAGADLFLMPSHFEPCGLNQMYSQRYGTIPIVRPVGGLADTVHDGDPEHATGFHITEATPDALVQAVRRALDLAARPADWRTLQANGLRQDFSWTRSAHAYHVIYRELCAASPPQKAPRRKASGTSRPRA